MAFFDELGKKISQTGQRAVQKTKEMADVAKLNSNITEEEKKINNAYYQIGQLYVSKHEEDAEDEFRILIEQLKESQKKIEELKKQIQVIKGVKRCTTCGAEIPEDATFCSFCGAGITQQKTVDATNLNKCDNCGKMIEKGMKFCTYCGSPVVEKAPQNEKKCLKCGSVLKDDVDFCTHCGTPVVKEEPKQQDALCCTQCGAPIEDGVMFCINCGTKVEIPKVSEDSGETAEETAIQETPIIKEPPVVLEEPESAKEAEIEEVFETLEETAFETANKICSNCGTELEEDAVFCIKCGTKVNATPSVAEQGYAKRICPNCGFEAEEYSVFCVKCGTKIN